MCFFLRVLVFISFKKGEDGKGHHIFHCPPILSLALCRPSPLSTPKHEDCRLVTPGSCPNGFKVERRLRGLWVHASESLLPLARGHCDLPQPSHFFYISRSLHLPTCWEHSSRKKEKQGLQQQYINGELMYSIFIYKNKNEKKRCVGWGVWVVCWMTVEARANRNEDKLAVNSDTLPCLLRRGRFLLSAAV